MCFQLQTQLNIYRYTLHVSFTSICTSKYNHLIELTIKGHKVASQIVVAQSS